MRYCALMGSTKSCTPRFSTQKSPSSIFSSKVKPYWKPEQPPPETNTRNFRLGFASSRISSPTLPAAASVKISTSGMGGARSAERVDSEVVLMVPFYRPVPGQTKVLTFFATCVRPRAYRIDRPGARLASMDQLPINLGADGG